MEWVEITGRTVDEAVEAALDELGVDAADLEHEVLEEPKSGLFGRFGGSPARIRARVRPVSREKPGDANRRNRRQGGRSRGGSRSSSSRSSNDRSRPSGAGSSPGREDGDGDRTRGGGGGGRGAAVAASEGTSGGTRDGGEGPSGAPRRRRRGGRGRGRSGGSVVANGTTERSAGANRATGNGSTGEGKQMETMESDLSVEEQAAIAEQFTAGLVEAFDLGAEVTVVVEDDAILVEIDGSSVGLLVGPKGATLSAIEELVRTVVQRQTDGRGARINVDVGGYRAKRREALAAFTQQLAEQVLETQQPKALEPMSAPDRKTVHDAAAEIDGITTESEGEDSRRHVVLRPA